jgi:hypothetical protein
MREMKEDGNESFPADLMLTKQSRFGESKPHSYLDEIEGSIIEPYHDSFFEKSNKKFDIPVEDVLFEEDVKEDNKIEE